MNIGQEQFRSGTIWIVATLLRVSLLFGVHIDIEFYLSCWDRV